MFFEVFFVVFLIWLFGCVNFINFVKLVVVYRVLDSLLNSFINWGVGFDFNILLIILIFFDKVWFFRIKNLDELVNFCILKRLVGFKYWFCLGWGELKVVVNGF